MPGLLKGSSFGTVVVGGLPPFSEGLKSAVFAGSLLGSVGG